MPGDADLSAEVDFAAFAAAVGTTEVDFHGPIPQDRFLQALGARARLAALCEHAAPEQRNRLESGLDRLLDPEQMGDLFKVMPLTSRGLPAPPGFDGREPMR